MGYLGLRGADGRPTRVNLERECSDSRLSGWQVDGELMSDAGRRCSGLQFEESGTSARCFGSRIEESGTSARCFGSRIEELTGTSPRCSGLRIGELVSGTSSRCSGC